MTYFQKLFNFSLPTNIIYGPGCISSLPEALREHGGMRPIVVTDKGVRNAGILAPVEKLLTEAGIAYVVFDGVEANPKDTNVTEGAKAARAFGADCIVAVGGGSPIDCAKSIGVLLAHDADDIRTFEGKTAATKPQPLLISIPTTAGTGSELTFSSVITHSGEQRKMTVKSPYTAATVAICDPELTLSVPPHITASTGMDALTHAIEAYTANCAEPISDALALYAIELIMPHLRTAVPPGIRSRSDCTKRSPKKSTASPYPTPGPAYRTKTKPASLTSSIAANPPAPLPQKAPASASPSSPASPNASAATSPSQTTTPKAPPSPSTSPTNGVRLNLIKFFL